MAKLPALVKAVTAVDGREHKTIEHVARVVREAGFIPTGKRGGGSADVTYEAAANLIIGLNITDVPKRIPYELERMRSLATFICGNTDDHEAFRQLSEAKNFGEALALTIENVPAWWELACGYVESEYFPKSQEQRLSLQRMFTEGNGVFLIVVELQKYSASISFEKPIRSDADATMAAPNTEEVYFQSFMQTPAWTSGRNSTKEKAPIAAFATHFRCQLWPRFTTW